MASLVIALLAAPMIGWLLKEGVTRYEMWSTGMAHRAELAGNLGFGLLLFMVVIPGTFAGLIGVFSLSYIWLKRKVYDKDGTDHRRQ